MLPFVDYIQQAFCARTRWDRDNSYTSLTATSQALLDFPTPTNLHLTCSSLPTPNFATSYTLNTLGLISGSASYLYSSTPLALVPINESTNTSVSPITKSTSSANNSTIPLRFVVPGYRHLPPFAAHEQYNGSYGRHSVQRLDRTDTLLFGRIYVPSRFLEALLLRRLGPTTLLRVAAVSADQEGGAPSGGGTGGAAGSVLVSWAKDVGKWGVEIMGSSDNGLLGIRGLWNVGKDLRAVEEEKRMNEKSYEQISTKGKTANPYMVEEDSSTLQHALQSPFNRHPPSRLSAGFEFYYSPLNKTGGLSTGLRFTTLTPRNHHPMTTTSTSFSQVEPTALMNPSKPAPLSSSTSQQSPLPPPFPYTLTVTLSPLVGTLSTTYSLLATPLLALSSRFDFNVYSYESEFVMGAELWRPGSNRKLKSRIRYPWQIVVREDLQWAAEKASLWYSPIPTSSLRNEPRALAQAPSPSPSSPPSLSPPPSSSAAPANTADDDSNDGVLKMRTSSSGVRVLWVSRLSSILYSVGVQLGWDEVGGKRKGVRAVGIEIGYVS